MLEVQVLNPKQHDRKGFNCGNNKLDEFLSAQACSAAKRNLSRTKVLIDDRNERQIIGYYTFSYCSLTCPKDSPLKNYPHPIPALLLSRLAVDKAFQNQKLGEQLLLNALCDIARIHVEGLSPAPVVGVFVDAKNKSAQQFYERYGFVAVDPIGDPHKLWLPIQDCVDTFNFIFD